jgi:hypothetical protein
MRFLPQGILPPVRRGAEVDAAERAALLDGEAELYSLGREESA